jgi:hypothetical protein
MAQTAHHLDGLIDLLVDAVVREIETENFTTKKADAGSLLRAPGRPGDFEHGKHTPITDERKNPPVPQCRDLQPVSRHADS